MDERPLDAEQILRTLSEHDVDYILIGGLAVQTHGHVRTTMDADIIPAPAPRNLQRLAKALRTIHARLINPGQQDTAITGAMLPRATIRQFSTEHGGIDVMHEVPGGAPFAELKARAIHVELGDVEVPVAGLDDLIRMKLARGRPQDIADVAALTDDGR